MNKINLVFIDFFDNFIFYNFLNDYKIKYLNQFVIDFDIKYIEGNFPHSFFTQYNYLKLDKYYLVDRTRILDILDINQLPLCIDLNNKNLKISDINDKYLLMILLTLNNKNHYIHCNQHNIAEILYTSLLDFVYIDDSYCKMLNAPIQNIDEENKIYNFSNIKTQFKNITQLNLKQLSINKIYKIMTNNINDIIKLLILPEYQFIFYEEFLKYEKTFSITRFLGKSIDFNSSVKSL